MATLTVRNVDEEVKQGARLAGARNGRSMEAEIRALLDRTYAAPVDDRVARIRAMSPREAIAHLVEIAGGVGLDIPELDAEDIEFPEL